MDILDLSQFIDNGIVAEAAFFEKVERFDWEQYRDKRVLVKGCGTTIIPPWAFMTVAAHLSQVAKRVHYGNEHSSIAVFSRTHRETTDVN